MKKIIFSAMVYSMLMTGVTAGMVDTFMDACEQGDMQGCYQAGVAYWQGEGISKDRQAGKSLLQIACDGGFSDACVALKTLNEEESSVTKGEKTSVTSTGTSYSGSFDGKLYGDIDGDGKDEIVGWKKFATTDLGDYYQLLVVDDDGALLWKGPKEKSESNPYIFSSLDIGVSLPALLFDVDNDGYVELLAPQLQSDVSPTYFKKLRWNGTSFEPLLSNALMLSSSDSDRFIWKKTSQPYGIWVSRLTPYRDGLFKADVTAYRQGQNVKSGVALLRFNREGASVSKWLKPIFTAKSSSHTTANRHTKIGVVYGLDPHGDGFLSIRVRPNAREIGRLYNGDKVEILGRKGKWFKIRSIRFGTVGWSHSNWIRTY